MPNPFGGAGVPASVSGGISGFTAGSVPFGGSDGGFDQDNTKLFWDDTDDKFQAGPRTGLDANWEQYYFDTGKCTASALNTLTAGQITAGEANNFVSVLANNNAAVSTIRGALFGAYTSTAGSPIGVFAYGRYGVSGGGGAATGGTFNAIASAGTNTTLIGVQINSAAKEGAATVANAKGLVIDNQTIGATTNYAIQTGTGLVDFGDRLQVTQATAGSQIFGLTTTATNDDPNFKVYQNRAATTDATVTTIQTLAISASNSYLIDARVVARRTGGAAGTADDGAAYIRRCLVTTKTGTVTVNATQDGLTQEDQAGWNVTFAVSGSNILVQVTGAVDNNVTWHSTTFVQSVGS